MRSYKYSLALLLVGIFAGCGNSAKLITPLDTLKSYTQAIKKNDAETMRKLLSEASLKMADQEAKSRNVPIDEIIKRETLFSEGQKSLTFRNEKIENDKATIEVENSFNSWDTVFFVKESGIWKIDKQGTANQMMQQIDQQNKKLDDIINQP